MFRKIKIIKSYKKLEYHTSKINLNKYTNTVLLPKTKFPQKLIGNRLSEQNKYISEKARFDDLYDWQKSNLKGEFIIHDGPPYANGLPHMGHAINKILKDVINRQQIILGNRVNYIPGWDCHGLPIELKALSKSKNGEKTTAFIRSTAREFATKTIEKQLHVFKSWGVTADWNNSYLTYSVPYIENQLKQFYKLYEKKLIYRDVKPVYWSPSSKTALAEAELEYNETHTSTAVIMQFKISKIPDTLRDYLNLNSNIYALIWTTTPWTLPSNQAICYNSKLSYSFVKSDSKIYLIATELIENISKIINNNLEIIYSFKGHNLKGTTYVSPFNSNEILPFLSGDHATATKGTGLVHTAPAHGPEDFVLALNYKIPVKCIVNESGCYDSGEFKDLFVLTEGTNAVINYLKDNILNKSEYIHSYPYDWRTKKPVIIRSSKQWFIDTNSIKDRAIELLDNVKIYPEKISTIYKNNLKTQLKKRPYWCISRQRVWGVPIPVFYNKKTNSSIISKLLINHLCEILVKNGSDFWWNMPIDVLVPPKVLEEFNLNLNDIEKGQDILDIWFDSGISWSKVLGNEKIADLYLEGVDQFTGWFQSSLLTSVALRDKVPYKNIYVHSFAVDENGRKMSKSLGNVINPQDIIHGAKKQPAIGIDTLRWWVICHASHNSTAFITKNVLQASCDEVQKIRNTLRFALSNLHNTHLEESDLSLHVIDKYMLHLLFVFDKQITGMYQEYQFNKICISIINFITNPVSALYYSIIKDRLYCDSIEDNSRKAAQFVLDKIFNIVSKGCAPIIPYLIEELYYYRTNKHADSFFKSIDRNWITDEYFQPEIFKAVQKVLDIKKELNKHTNSLENEMKLKVSKQLYNELKIFKVKQELIEILQITDVHLTESEELQNDSYTISTIKTEKHMCLRCKRFASISINELCNRCSNIVSTK